MEAYGAKMKVKWAVQVLSHSVAAALFTCSELGEILGGEETAEFCERMDRLFNMLNSSVSDSKC